MRAIGWLRRYAANGPIQIRREEKAITGDGDMGASEDCKRLAHHDIRLQRAIDAARIPTTPSEKPGLAPGCFIFARMHCTVADPYRAWALHSSQVHRNSAACDVPVTANT
jgi:hypothetical protein